MGQHGRGFAPDGFYSFENLEGGFDGLVRVSGGGIFFEHVGDGGAWIKNQDIARHFVNPGTTFLEPIDDATARRLAARYGADLHDPQEDPDPSFASPKRPTAKPSTPPI
jgi:hypothetical protein